MVKKIQVKLPRPRKRLLLRKAALMSALAAFIVLFAPAASAESGNYRIEVLVFRHLNNTSAPVELAQLSSYFEFADVQEFLQPPAPVWLDVQSSAMQDNWRKLRLSAGFEPLLFAAWEQTRIDYHPPVRIHGEEVLTEARYFPYPPAAQEVEPDEPALVYTDLADPPEADPLSGAPPEDYFAAYFRLDGTAQLTRTRFLHLKLDLEFREAMLSVPVPTETGPHGEMSSQISPEAAIGATPGPAMVWALRQSRQITTGEFQYFDSPYLGVIARVTATSGE